MSDNDPKILNEEFDIFCKSNGIKHITSPIYHPISNGQAENSVKSCKKMLKSIVESNAHLSSEQMHEVLDMFLYEYRNCKHCATGESPAKLMFGRELRGRLDLILPSKSPEVDALGTIAARNFVINQKVLARCYVSRKPVWLPGTIVGKLGTRMFNVIIEDHGTCRRHVDQIRPFYEDVLPVAQPSCHSQPLQDSEQNIPSTSSSNAQIDMTETQIPEIINDDFFECESDDVVAPATVHTEPESRPCVGTDTDHSNLLSADDLDNNNSSGALTEPRYNLRPRRNRNYKE